MSAEWVDDQAEVNEMRIAARTTQKGVAILCVLGYRRLRQGLAIVLTAGWSILIYKLLRHKAEQEGRKSPI